MAATEIPCPFCGEMIKSTAKKCRFCNEFLEAGATRESILEKRAAETAAQAATPAQPSEASQPTNPEGTANPNESQPVGTTEAAISPAGLADLYSKVNAMPDSEAKTKLLENLKALETKSDDADETEVEGIIQSVTEYAPDVAEIAISTLINPASGVTTLVQKVAMRMSEGKKKE